MRMLRERKSQFVEVTQPSPSPAQCQSRAVFFTLNINEGKHLPSSPSLSSVLVQCGIKYHISCLIIQKTIVNDIFCQIVGVLYSPDTLNRRYLAKIVLTSLGHLSSPTLRTELEPSHINTFPCLSSPCLHNTIILHSKFDLKSGG